MELRKFIVQAISDIIGGVSDAQLRHPDGMIAPGKVTLKAEHLHAKITALQAVEFEVTVSTENVTGTEGGLTVGVPLLHAGGKGKTSEKREHAAVLRFSVPIILPMSTPKAQTKPSD